MSTTSFRMDEELEPKLDAIAQSLRRSKSWIINEALRLYIEREQRKQDMLKETEEALADLEANRLLSGEEVMQWLETWGKENEIEAPKL
jgi:predicted transcriptional regulator